MAYYDTKRFRPELQQEFHITFLTDDSKMKAYAKEKLWRQVSDYFMDFVKTYPDVIWTMKIEDEYESIDDSYELTYGLTKVIGTYNIFIEIGTIR